jgi:apocytochrome f
LEISGKTGGFKFSGGLVGYPVFAQQAYSTPISPTGTVVCANCHLSTLSTGLSLPYGVGSDSVFESIVSAPYPRSSSQLSDNGTASALNLGGVISLPEGFSLPTKSRLPRELSLKTQGRFIEPYSKEQTNIMLIGPVEGQKNRDLLFPALSPKPDTSAYTRYSVDSAANRGRGQVYPAGDGSNSSGLRVSKARSGLVSSRVGGSKAEELMIVGYPATTSSYEGYTSPGSSESASSASESAVRRTEKKTVKRFKRLVPGCAPKNLTLGGSIMSGDEVFEASTSSGLGQCGGSILVRDSSRITSLIVGLFTIAMTQLMLSSKKTQLLKVQLSEAII